MASINTTHTTENPILSRLSLAERFRFDMVYAVILVLIVGFGLLMVYSATFDLGFQRVIPDSLYFFKRQFGAAILGGAAILILLQFDYVYLTRISVPALFLTIFLLLAVDLAVC